MCNRASYIQLRELPKSHCGRAYFRQLCIPFYVNVTTCKINNTWKCVILQFSQIICALKMKSKVLELDKTDYGDTDIQFNVSC